MIEIIIILINKPIIKSIFSLNIKMLNREVATMEMPDQTVMEIPNGSIFKPFLNVMMVKSKRNKIIILVSQSVKPADFFNATL